MGNYSDKPKLNKYGRNLSNDNERQRYDGKVEYKGNVKMQSSVIRLNSSFSPQRNGNLSSSIKNSKMLTSEIITNSMRKDNGSYIDVQGIRQENNDNMKTSSRSRSGSRMEKSFRQLKDEEIRQQKMARRLIKYSKLNEEEMKKIEEIKKSVNFITASFEIQQVDMIPLSHLASLSNLEGEMYTQNIEYKLINYPKHKNKQDIQLLNQMMQFENLSSNNDKQSYIETFGLKKSMIRDQSNIESKQNTDNLGQRLKEKQDIVSSLKQNQQNEHLYAQKNNQNDFLSISQKLNNKQHEFKMQGQQFARPVESHIYPTPESQMRSKGNFTHNDHQQIHHDNEHHLIYVGNPLMVSSRITHRDDNSTLQNNMSNISIDSNVKQRQQQQNYQRDNGNFIKIEQQFSSTSTPQTQRQKSIHQMIHERKLSQNSIDHEPQPNNQTSIYKQLQQSKRLNSDKFSGEQTFGGSRFRSQSEAQLPSKNFQSSVDCFDKSLINTQAYIQQRQQDKQQKILLQQQQDVNQVDSSNKSVSRDEKQGLNISEHKVDSTPKFRISLGQNHLQVSGKFGLQSHSTTSNDHQSSKGNINPAFTLNTAGIPEVPGEYVLSSQDNPNHQNYIPVQKEDCSTQTNNSLRYSSHLDYLTNLHRMRTIRTSSPHHRNYFEPLVIGPSESQSYSELIKRMKNFYNKQSKFLFDSITNKKYNDYKPQNSSDQSNKSKKKRQKKILQITSKPKKKVPTPNSYADLHKQQNKKLNRDLFENENYQEFFSNHHHFASTSNLYNQSYASNLQNYTNSTRLNHSSKISQNNSQNNHQTSPPHNKSAAAAFRRQNQNQPSSQSGYAHNEYMSQTSPLLRTQNYKLNSNDKMFISTRINQQLSSSPSQQKRSRSRTTGEHTSRSQQIPQMKQNYTYSSNYEDEDDDINNLNSHILNISSNTTSDMQPPIQISLGVSQFKKKSTNNSGINDRQLNIRNNSPEQNQPTITHQILKNRSNSPATKENNKISNNQYKQSQVGGSKQNQRQERRQGSPLQQKKILDKMNTHPNFTSYSNMESPNNKHQFHNFNHNNQEDEFIERYINQSSQKKPSNERNTPSRKSKERSSKKHLHKQSPNNLKKIHKQKNYSPNGKQQFQQYQFQQGKLNNKIFTSMGINGDLN